VGSATPRTLIQEGIWPPGDVVEDLRRRHEGDLALAADLRLADRAIGLS
jgi:hypothetical protein